MVLTNFAKNRNKQLKVCFKIRKKGFGRKKKEKGFGRIKSFNLFVKEKCYYKQTNILVLLLSDFKNL